jgi:6-pyruvoyltetrahydropterin/6-carboxytetrahydropterin synthase
MVLDFGYVKELLMTKVHDVLDHGFIVYEFDQELLARFSCDQNLPEEDRESPYDWKTIIFPYVPTAENIAKWVFEELQEPINSAYNETAYLDGVKVWETPTSSAVYFGEYVD